jgi:hypothetical protein
MMPSEPDRWSYEYALATLPDVSWQRWRSYRASLSRRYQSMKS